VEVLKFDIASFDMKRYPSGAIIVIKSATEELSFEVGDEKYVKVSFRSTETKRKRKHNLVIKNQQFTLTDVGKRLMEDFSLKKR